MERRCPLLSGIVELRSRNETELREQICGYVDEFVAHAVGGAGGLHARIAEAFGIVYVAGRLACHFGVLPEEWDPFAIALECYRRYAASIQIAEGKSVRDLLAAYATRPDVIDLDQGVPTLTDQEMATVSGFRQSGPQGIELIVPPGSITRLFADWQRKRDSVELAPSCGGTATTTVGSGSFGRGTRRSACTSSLISTDINRKRVLASHPAPSNFSMSVNDRHKPKI